MTHSAPADGDKHFKMAGKKSCYSCNKISLLDALEATPKVKITKMKTYVWYYVYFVYLNNHIIGLLMIYALIALFYMYMWLQQQKSIRLDFYSSNWSNHIITVDICSHALLDFVWW